LAICCGSFTTFQDNTLDSLIIPQQVCWKALLTCSQVSQSLFAQLYYSMWILARASCGSLKLFLQKHGDFADRMDQVSMRQVWADVNESLQRSKQSHNSMQLVRSDSAFTCLNDQRVCFVHTPYLPLPQTHKKRCSAGWSKQAPMQIKLVLPLLLSCHAAAMEQSQSVCVQCCFRKHVADDDMCTQVTSLRCIGGEQRRRICPSVYQLEHS